MLYYKLTSSIRWNKPHLTIPCNVFNSKLQRTPCFGMIVNTPLQHETMISDRSIIIPPESMTLFYISIINSIYNNQDLLVHLDS